MSPRSTAEIAKLIGITKVTLERWLAQGKVSKPKQIRIGTRLFRLWTDKAIKRVRRYKEKSYRKGRGRKSKSKG